MARVNFGNYKPAGTYTCDRIDECFDDWSCCEPQTAYGLAAATFENVPTAYAGVNDMQRIALLRREGKVDEAYGEARRLLALNAADPWARKAMAWCIKALCERAATRTEPEEFLKWFAMLESLDLARIDECMMHNRLGWDMYQLLDRLRSQPERQLAVADRLFELVRRLQFKKPDKYYSIMLEAFARVSSPRRGGWPRFVDFADWWGWNNLLPTDYLRKSLPDKHIISSIAERAVNACYRSLTARMQNGGMPSERVEAFAALLEELGKTHPEFQYTLYQRATLLLMLGRRQDALGAVLPFVRANRDKFWVWDILGDCVDDDELKLACCCRALTCRADVQFLSRVRLKAAQLMHRFGDDGNARTEIRLLHELYTANGWRMPREALVMKNSDWYQQAVAPPDNKAYYNSRVDAAEACLFRDTPEVPVLIYRYNAAKRLCHFVTDKLQRGFFFASGLKTRIVENGIYLMRSSEGAGDSDQWRATKVYTLRRLSGDETKRFEGLFFKTVEGVYRRPEGRAFGFVEDAYLEAGPLSLQLQPGSKVRAVAALTYRLKTAQWGWNVVRLEPDGDIKP